MKNRKKKIYVKQLLLESADELEGSVSPTNQPDDLLALKSTLDKERDAHKTATKALKAKEVELKSLSEKFADINPEEYKRLLDQRETFQSLADEKESLKNSLTNAFAAEKDALLGNHNTVVSGYQATIESLQLKISEGQRSRLLEKEFNGANGRTDIASDGISYFGILEQFVGKNFVLSEDGAKLAIVGPDGNAMMSIANPKEPIGVAEYLKSLHIHPVLGNCFKLENPPSGTGVNAPNIMLKGKLESKPQSLQERLVRARALDKKKASGEA
jgi:hypothetical protein